MKWRNGFDIAHGFRWRMWFWKTKGGINLKELYPNLKEIYEMKLSIWKLEILFIKWII